MTSTAPSTKQLESSTPSETAIRWPTTELLLSSLGRRGPPALGQGRPALQFTPAKQAGGVQAAQRQRTLRAAVERNHPSHDQGERIAELGLAEGAVEPRYLILRRDTWITGCPGPQRADCLQ